MYVCDVKSVCIVHRGYVTQFFTDANKRAAKMGHEVCEGDHPFTASSILPFRDTVVFDVSGFESETMSRPECISVPHRSDWPEVGPWIELVLPRPGTVYVNVAREALAELKTLGWREAHDCSIFFEISQRIGLMLTEAPLVSKDFPEGPLTLTYPAVGAVLVSQEKRSVVVTLSVAEVGDDGCLHIACHGLGGEAIATIKAEAVDTVGTIQKELAARLDIHKIQVTCLTTDGRLLGTEDAVSIVHTCKVQMLAMIMLESLEAVS